MNFMQWMFVSFTTVAIGGVSMAVMIAMRVRVPRRLRSIHGLLGLGSLALLFALNLHGGTTTSSLAWWALGLLSTALLGGLALFRAVFVGTPPLLLVSLHGVVAIAGLCLLYLAAW